MWERRRLKTLWAFTDCYRESFTVLSVYGSTSLVDLGRVSSFLIYTSAQSVGLLERGISPSQGRYLHTEQHKHRINADIHVSSGIRTHDLSVFAGENGSHLRPRDHSDWPKWQIGDRIYNISLTGPSALDGGEYSAECLDRFILGKEPLVLTV
jgi:hypothetical protein